MLPNNKPLTERLNIIKSETSQGIIWVGAPVNYPSIIMQGKTIDDLKHKVKIAIKMWMKFTNDIISQKEPFDVHELTKDEWEAKEDNIDHWEIERMQRVLSRPTIKNKMLALLSGYIIEEMDESAERAEKISHGIYNQMYKLKINK